MRYELVYSEVTGNVIAIRKFIGGVCYSFFCLRDSNNTDYQEFLIWNKAQKTPLDLKSTIPVVPPVPVRDLAKELDELKAEVEKLKKK